MNDEALFWTILGATLALCVVEWFAWVRRPERDDETYLGIHEEQWK